MSRINTTHNRQRSRRMWLAGDIAGWYGTIVVIGAYALISFKIVESDSAIYQLLNLTGATGVIVMAAIKHVPQSIVLNIFWAGIALIALLSAAL